MNDIERLNQLEKRIEELQLETMRLRSRLDQYDEGEAEARILRRIQYKLFVQQLYSIVTKEQIRQWIEEAAQTAAEKYAERYVNTDRLQRWMHDTVTVLFKQEGTQWVVREIVAKMASQYVIAPKDGQK